MDRPDEADLADDAGPHGGAAGAVLEILYEEIGHGLLVHFRDLRRMEVAHVERCPHHDLDPGLLGDLPQECWTAADADGCHLDKAASPGLAVLGDGRSDEVVINQLHGLLE